MSAAGLVHHKLEKPASPKHSSLLLLETGKSEKLMHLDAIHARHASVPDSLLMKGSMSNEESGGWSPAHDRLAEEALTKTLPQPSDVKHATGNKAHNGPATAMKKLNRTQVAQRSADEESSVDYDSSLENTSVSSFDFNRERGNQQQQQQHQQHQQQQHLQQQTQQQQGRSVVSTLHKAAPSKWDDAEKWLSGDRNSRPRMQQLVSSIPSHVIINASKKAALLGRMGIAKPGSLDFLSDSNDMLISDPSCTKKIDSAYRFSFMPSPGNPAAAAAAKSRSMSCSLDRYPLEELLECEEGGGAGKLKVVRLCDTDDDVSKQPALCRTEKPTSDLLPDKGSPGNAVAAVMMSPPPSSTRDGYGAPTGLRSVSMRDMGTEMTPIASQEPSRTGTPLRATTPTIRSPVSSRPSTPGRAAGTPPPPPPPALPAKGAADSNKEAPTADAELSEKQLQASKTRQEILALGTQLGKANIAAWASREEEEEDASRCLKNMDVEEIKKNVVEARAVAWEEAEKAKYEARYKREEAKIVAWENHERAKAEAEMRRIEVKVERMRSHAHEQLMNKLASARRRAEELRAAAESRRVEQAAKTAERAEYIRQTGSMPPPSGSSSSPLSALLRICC